MSDNINNENKDPQFENAVLKSKERFEKNIIFDSIKFIRNNFQILKFGYHVTYVCCNFNKTVKNPNPCKCKIKLFEAFTDPNMTLTKLGEHTCPEDNDGEVMLKTGVLNIKENVSIEVANEAINNPWKKPKVICQEIMQHMNDQYEGQAISAPSKQAILKQIYYERSNSAGTEGK